MSPQAVDFNGDGFIDIVAGTFDGSPHVAFGSNKGFAQPEHILNRNGKRIIFNNFWDYKQKKWAHKDKKINSQCTSAFAYDWDADGDFDLLLGDYRGGKVFRLMNEGSKAKPLFAEKGILVTAGGKAIKLDNKLATLRMVDWNRDGRLDLMCGNIGKTYPQAAGGELWVFLDQGQNGKPVFAPGKCLIRAKVGSNGQLAGPGAGFYFDAVDYDGDGDLDLLVGGKATITPEGRTLTSAQKKRVGEIKKLLKANSQARSIIFREIQKEAGKRDQDWRKRYTQARNRMKPKLDPLMETYRKLKGEQDALIPTPKTKNLVWVYINKAC